MIGAENSAYWAYLSYPRSQLGTVLPRYWFPASGLRGCWLLALFCLLDQRLIPQLGAADFKLLAAGIQPSVTTATTSTNPRFSLNQTSLTPVSSTVPAVGQRFGLQAQAGVVVLLQQAGLPQLRLQAQGADWELSWEDQPLLTGLILESSTMAAQGGWQPEAVEVTPTGRRLLIRQPAQGVPARFYRLRK